MFRSVQVYNNGDVLFENENLVQLLAAQTSLCGNFPASFLASSRHAEDFFLKSGLLYESVPPAVDGGEPLFALFKIERSSIREVMTGKKEHDRDPNMLVGTVEEEDQFVDFLENLLKVEPKDRLTADQALQHPFITSRFVTNSDDDD